jgi:hypothetical protein
MLRSSPARIRVRAGSDEGDIAHKCSAVDCGNR